MPRPRRPLSNRVRALGCVALAAFACGATVQATGALEGLERATVKTRFDVRGVERPDDVRRGRDRRQDLRRAGRAVAVPALAARACDPPPARRRRAGDRLRRPVHRAHDAARGPGAVSLDRGGRRGRARHQRERRARAHRRARRRRQPAPHPRSRGRLRPPQRRCGRGHPLPPRGERAGHHARARGAARRRTGPAGRRLRPRRRPDRLPRSARQRSHGLLLRRGARPFRARISSATALWWWAPPRRRCATST